MILISRALVLCLTWVKKKTRWRGKEDAAERNEEDGEREGRQWEDKEEDKEDERGTNKLVSNRLSRLVPSQLDDGEKASFIELRGRNVGLIVHCLRPSTTYVRGVRTGSTHHTITSRNT
jgi:hypothetical protein